MSGKATDGSETSAPHSAEQGDAPAPADLATRLAESARELAEARAQQAATADVLRVISRSAFDLQAVLDTLVQTAAQLCEADSAAIHRRSGDNYPYVAGYGYPADYDAYMRKHVFVPTRETAFGRAVLDAGTVHVPDVNAGSAPVELAPGQREMGGISTVLCVPLMRAGAPIGVIALTRRLVRPFTARQIALVESFADQAVIAIENVRLLDAEQQRSRELAEALEQQTATSEVLRVIARSPTDIRPVLDAVAENAARLCEANNAVIFRLDGGLLRQMAAYGQIPTSSHPVAGLPVDRATVTGRAVFEQQTIHVHDLASAESEYPEGSRHAKLDGHRTTLAMPMLREGVPIGAILIRRMEVRPFSQRQIELVTTFADQAAIAIENVRLFNETREALEQQTATSEVLQVISTSPGELEPVFQAMLKNATRICEAKFGVLFRYHQGRFCVVAALDVPQASSPISCCADARIRAAAGTGNHARTPRGGRSKRPTRPTAQRSQIHRRRRPWAALVRPSQCRCSRITSWSALSSSTARRCVRSPTSRSSW